MEAIDLQNIYPADLPPLAREIADLIGLPLCLRLITKHGGQHLYFTRDAKPNNWLTICIGPNAATKLCLRFRSTWQHLPRCAKALRNYRDRTIQHKYDTDQNTINELAQDYGLTERQIWNIMKKSLGGGEVGIVRERVRDEGQLEFEV